MYSKILKTVSLACTLLFVHLTFAQTVINYETWAPPNPLPCNIFANAVNINGISHQTSIGQPRYNVIDKSIIIDCKSTNETPSLGTEYKINYIFKKAHSYKIVVNAARIKPNPDFPNCSLQLLPSNTYYYSGNCNNVQNITANNTYIQSILGNAFLDYAYNLPAFASEHGYLYIAAIPSYLGSFQSISIRKITITEIPPTPAFSLSPTSVNKLCALPLEQIFTVTNIYNSPNVTSYEWDLGNANNGWLYKGQPAPQYISTLSNTITLSANGCTNALSNVSATVKINNNNYKTYNSTTSLSLPNLSITGNSLLCNTAQYKIDNLPCNASVLWSANPNNYVVIEQPNSPVTNIKKLIDGSTVTLSADVSGCGINKKITKQVALGIPNLDIEGMVTQTKIYAGQYLNLSVNTPHATSYLWKVFGGKVIGSASKNTVVIQVDKCKPYQKQNNNFSASVTVKNTCGTEYVYSEWTEAICNTGHIPDIPAEPLVAGQSLFFSVSPNPAKNDLYVKLNEHAMEKVAKTTMVQYELYDFYTNQLVKQWKFTHSLEQKLDIRGIKKGKYILFVKITQQDNRNRSLLIKSCLT
ncbi:MAG: hypothetical protein IPJ81_19000 [Chitinophagaceae bacterium]|nr:hypothetical protein [Chitinophagaceae bacterium]